MWVGRVEAGWGEEPSERISRLGGVAVSGCLLFRVWGLGFGV